MKTFFEYVINRDFHESVDPEAAEIIFNCKRSLENLFLWYSDNLGKKEEFYDRLEENIRECFKHSLLHYQRGMVIRNIVDEEEVINRTLMRVHNTVEEKIRNRYQEYNEKTAPLMSYYDAQGKFFAVNGIGTIEEITQRLSTIIDKL